MIPADLELEEIRVGANVPGELGLGRLGLGGPGAGLVGLHASLYAPLA